MPTAPVIPNDDRGVLHFVSRPDLTPPALTITHHGPSGSTASDPPYIILSPAGYPRTGPGAPGLMILDRHGNIVWYSPNNGFPASKGEGRLDLKVQIYRGKPVLTWWEGQILRGYGEGRAVIADTSYRTIATIDAGHGLQADLHEFVISPQDTALVTAYRPVTTDLSGWAARSRGMVLSGVVQEIDIPSGRVLFEWDSLDHVPVTDTYVPFAGGTTAYPFDYFHINSIAIAPDGNLLVSGAQHQRDLQDRPAEREGDVAARAGSGPASRWGRAPPSGSSTTSPPQSASTLSIFDDGGAPPVKEPQSRGILLNLDTSAMRATLHAQLHPPGAPARRQPGQHAGAGQRPGARRLGQPAVLLGVPRRTGR